MGQEVKDKILREVRKDFLQEQLLTGKRFDGRAPDEWRSVEVQKGVITTAEGSALANIGGSKVLAAVKFDMMTPFPDRPDEGAFITNAEFVPMASPAFEPGPPNENCIELARVVDRGIRSSNVIDMSKLFIEEGKVLGLFLDLWVLDHKGNLTDTAALAACAALTDTKLPKVEEGKIIRGEGTTPMEIKYKPLTTTFIKVGKDFLLDATQDEEYARDMSFTVGTVEGMVSSIQKSGPGGLSKDEVMGCVEVALRKSDELRRYL
ncbi:MAG: exosome complex protein Rrp42 [candidate division WOR-3 bacterium]